MGAKQGYHILGIYPKYFRGHRCKMHFNLGATCESFVSVGCFCKNSFFNWRRVEGKTHFPLSFELCVIGPRRFPSY